MGKQIYGDEDFKGRIENLEISDGIYYYSIDDNYCDKLSKGWIQVIR